MRRLFDALGVDYDHWKALTTTALRIDFRASRLGAASFGHAQARAAGLLIGQFVFYSFMGAAIAAGVWFTRDLFLAGLIVLSYVMFMVATAALLDHNAAIASPDDHAILGFRPVTSRTYFAARLVNVLVYTTAMTAVFSYIPIVAYFIRHGAAVGMAITMAIYAASLLTALTMIVSYAWLVRTVGPNRLRRVLSYVQFLLSFVVYGGFFALSRVFQVGVIGQLSLPKSMWMLLLPPAWFASYLEIAAGRISALDIALAGASVVALVGVTPSRRQVVARVCRSAGGDHDRGAVPRANGPRGRRGVHAGEARAVALLIRSQFPNDMKFRMSVLAIVPLTIVYLLMGIEDGGIRDPFEAGEVDQGLSMVTSPCSCFRRC